MFHFCVQKNKQISFALSHNKFYHKFDSLKKYPFLSHGPIIQKSRQAQQESLLS